MKQHNLFASPSPTPGRQVMNGKPVFHVEAKTIINFDSAFRHKLLCDGPTFSTGSACAYSCAFCYVPDLMRKLRAIPQYEHVEGQHERIVIRREQALEVMRRQLLSPKGRELGQKRLVIYASPLVDVAANLALVDETIEACKLILDLTKWDIRLLSKSNLLPRIADALLHYSSASRDRVIYGVSTGTLDNGIARAIEGGTPLVSKRIESLHWLQDNGFRTFGMVCPSLPQPEFAYNKFAREMAAAIRADRCEHVWAEVINARGESFDRTLAALREAGYEKEWERLTRVRADREAMGGLRA